jgi:hypothetical protein
MEPHMTYHLLVELDLLNLACPLELLQPLRSAPFVVGPPLLRPLVLPPFNFEPLLLLGP